MTEPAGANRRTLQHAVFWALYDSGIGCKINDGFVEVQQVRVPLADFEEDFDEALSVLIDKVRNPEGVPAYETVRGDRPQDWTREQPGRHCYGLTIWEMHG